MSGQHSELTAEWTVHAQLTITHPDKRVNINVKRDVENNNNNNNNNNNENKPIKITYNYNTTDDLKQQQDNTKFKKSFIFPSSSNKVDQDTTKDPVQSSLTGSYQNTSNNNNNNNNAKCRSTCSIVLSACTDLFPQQNEENSINSSTNNINNNSSSHLLFSNADATTKTEIISFKDAYSQTNKPVKKKDEQRKLKSYDYRRITESMLSPGIPQSVNEGHSRSPSNLSGFSRQSPGNNSLTSNDKKQPRTVHIDVYCTGSEEEESESTNSSSANYIAEEDSNSTPQTVYETKQMRLEHIKSGPNDLPRRMVKDPSLIVNSPKKGGTPDLTCFDKLNEIKESKRILFNKHIGDQKFNRYNNTKLHKLDFRKDISDDAISSNYPNSSYSTVRDLTSSSLSSALASNSAVYDDSTWKDNYFFPSDYDNISDGEQFKQISLNYMRPNYMNDESLSFYPQRERLTQSQQREYVDPTKHSNLNSMMFLSNNRFDLSQTINEDVPYTHEKPINSRFEHRVTRGGSPFVYDTNSSNRPKTFHSSFDEQTSTSSTSTLKSNLSGYTNDHLLRAKRFGAVVSALRKPGHHIGPVKNPDCLCEHCKRWMIDRELNGRGRAYSMGNESSVKRPNFWSNKNLNTDN